MLIERYISGLSTLAYEIRRQLKSAKCKEVNIRPIGRLENADSQKQYTGYQQQFICYCLQLITIEEVEGDSVVLRRDIDNNEDASSENADNITGGINENGDNNGNNNDEEVEDKEDNKGGENDKDNTQFFRDA